MNHIMTMRKKLKILSCTIRCPKTQIRYNASYVLIKKRSGRVHGTISCRSDVTMTEIGYG